MKPSVWDLHETRKQRISGQGFVIEADYFREIGGVLDAFWQHEGEPATAPYHAIMVSGLHTNGFVNCSTYLAHTDLADMLCSLMIRYHKLADLEPDVVVGPGNAAITLSFELARQLGSRHGFTEKDTDGRPTKIGGRMQIQPGERVLIVNELMSTPGGSTLQCKEGVLKHQPEAMILPFASVLVNRSGVTQLADGMEVRSLYDFVMQTWSAEACPYCQAGSMPIKPKITRENWLKLTGKMA